MKWLLLGYFSMQVFYCQQSIYDYVYPNEETKVLKGVRVIVQFVMPESRSVCIALFFRSLPVSW